MKKLFSIIIILLLVAPSALAQTLEMGAETEVLDGIRLQVASAAILAERNGETSQTHQWIAVDFSLWNYRQNDFSTAGIFSAELVYDGAYRIAGAVEISPEVLEPLVRAAGRIVFRVPNLVLETGKDKRAFTLSVENNPYDLKFGYQGGSGVTGDQPLYFEQPEDAVIRFAEYVAQADFQGALDTMADRAIAEKFDLLAQIRRLKAFMGLTMTPFPSQMFESYLPLNKAVSRAANARGIYGFVTSLVVGGFDVERMVTLNGDGNLVIADGKTISAEAFVNLYDPEPLKGLKLQKVYALDSEIFRSERNQNNMKAIGAISGYGDARELAALYAYNGETYLHTCTAGLFENGWQIIRLNASLLGTSPTGMAARVSDQEAAGLAVNSDYVLLFDSAAK